MSLQLYLAFVAAASRMPAAGVVVTLVIADAAACTRAALTTSPGVQAGLAIVDRHCRHRATSLMATMGYWFDWVRFAGAGLSGLLGIKLIRAPPAEAVNADARRPRRAAGFSCRVFWCCSRTQSAGVLSARSFRSSWT